MAQDCVCLDSFLHYLVRPMLRGITAESIGTPVGHAALDRLGVSMDWLDLRLTALAHHVDRSLKLGKDGIDRPLVAWASVMHNGLQQHSFP